MSAPKLCHGCAPVPRVVQIAEDAVASWLECKVCGKQSEHVEDAYSDLGTAQALWNADRLEQPAKAETP